MPAPARRRQANDGGTRVMVMKRLFPAPYLSLVLFGLWLLATPTAG